MTIDARLSAIGTWVGEVADAACDGCKGEPMLKYDSDCYSRCETFAAEVERLEKE